MEKIKQAIEKARQQGGQKAELQRPVAVSPAPTSEVGEFSYRQTRVVRLNPRHLEKNRIVAMNKSNLSSLSFDLLRTKVLQKMEEQGWRTLAIASPVAECGKTVVALNLAIAIAHHSNKTAMLVDFDLRKPKVAEYLGLPDGPSLNEVLEGNADVSEAFVNPGMPRLVVLPVARPIRKSAEMLDSTRVNQLIGDLRERYKERIVIFDLPPILNTDDAIVVLPKIDCVLVVVANGMCTKKEIEDCLHHIPEAKLVGTVLNKAEGEPRSDYY